MPNRITVRSAVFIYVCVKKLFWDRQAMGSWQIYRIDGHVYIWNVCHNSQHVFIGSFPTNPIKQEPAVCTYLYQRARQKTCNLHGFGPFVRSPRPKNVKTKHTAFPKLRSRYSVAQILLLATAMGYKPLAYHILSTSPHESSRSQGTFFLMKARKGKYNQDSTKTPLITREKGHCFPPVASSHCR